MRIAVNTRLLLKDRLEGIGWFTYESLKRIVENHPEHDFIFIFDRKPDPSFIFGKNVTPVVANPQARHPVLWYLFFEFGVTRALKKHKADLFLSPDGWLSLRTKVPSVAVIHDLNFEAHPAFLPRYIAKYYHRYFPRFARKATRIATVSEFTKQDIHWRYGISQELIDVVYNGANERFHSFEKSEIAAVRKQYTQGKPYFLWVGLIHPRKNLENQLRAFIKFKEENQSDLKFVIVGARYDWTEALEELSTAMPYAKDIIFLGRQPMDVLISLYGAAHGLVYVSYFEGFGIPILEAFYAEIPVITSTLSSMPEICGNAGITVHPDDVTAIANAMKKVAFDEDARLKMIADGVQQRQKFSWDKTADALWKCLAKAIESPAK